ncbi:MAG: putative GNAT family N-acyltransferase, partial [Myxococcota bacterium]
FALRDKVFIDEQLVPPELERDAFDATAKHVVLMRGTRALATGRVRMLDGEPTAKVERVAVERGMRGTGLGRRIMEALEQRARTLGANQVRLAAQMSALPFYERLGYAAHGDVFLDAGIEHKWMTRDLGA